MSYNTGSRAVHRRMVLDCNNGKTYNTQPVTINETTAVSQTLHHTFEFSLWQDTYISKIHLKKTQIPYTFYNTMSATQGVTVSVSSTFWSAAAPTDTYTGTTTMQPTWFQLTPDNFIAALKATFLTLLNAGAQAPNVNPTMNLTYDPDDQQLGMTFITAMGRNFAGTQNLNCFLFNITVAFDNTLVSLENQKMIVENLYSQVVNSDQSFVSTTTAATNTYVGQVFIRATTLALNVQIFKPQIMNFVVPPYILIHSDIMIHSLVKPAIIVATQNQRQNELTSRLTDNNFSTVLGVGYLTQGNGMSSAVGRFYESLDDGNIENYLEMHHCTIKKFRIWFTYPDGTLIYWSNSRPILDLYFID